ncbi:CPBP family intramembrane glutamic endopeptidase [Mucilaginibacter sp.]|uniref:CPBP family intramembrane glutamic endopeptidase n=1 Tax=Mucilaginibacter sp. TaxID=1882438 RepID=UPI002610AD4F|nr:type II CAAX endopeptidase family protein [Mucilaginibacter sp.]MDB4925011.1 family intrarane metalloprotease [Mucilaginibacter sp.]
MAENIKSGKWIYTLLRVLLFCLSCAIVLAATSRLTQGWPGSKWVSIVSIAIAAAGSLVLTILFVRWERLKLKDVGVVPVNKSILRLFTGFVIGLFLAGMQPMLVLLSGHISLISNQINIASVSINLLLYLFIAGREEVAFRGYPLRSLNYVIGPWGAQLIVALIFAAEHRIGGMTWLQAIFGPGVGALLFGLAALKTKGIALPIGLHTAWNFGQWVLGFKDGTGLYKVVIEKGYEARADHAGWISYLLVMCLAILTFYFWKPRERPLMAY